MPENPKRVIKQAMAAHALALRQQVVGIRPGVARPFQPSPRGDAFDVHRGIASIMASLGFEVRSVERLDSHPVWWLVLRRGQVPRGAEALAVGLAFSEYLKHRGVCYSREDTRPWVSGDRIKIGFIWDAGVAGMVAYSKGNEAVFPPRRDE